MDSKQNELPAHICNVPKIVSLKNFIWIEIVLGYVSKHLKKAGITFLQNF